MKATAIYVPAARPCDSHCRLSAYDAQSRRTGIASGDYAASVGYANGKAATLGWQERTTSYTYRPGLNQLSGFTTEGTSTARAFEYDAQHRLTGIKLNGQLSTGYTLNEKDQRIRVESEDGSYWKFTYDGKSQVTAMERRRAGEEEQVTPGLYYGGFSYDDIGNWTETSRTGNTYYYLTSNILNQYTDVSTVWPMNTWNPTYDVDGNMLTGIMGWSYGWNGENRLISAENGDTRLEFSYDYMGRRFEKKVYTANVLTKHEKFVYDGYKLIQVLDALNSDAVTMTFVWHPESTGLDTPFSMTYDGEIYYYVTDGNKNVMSLIDAAGTKVAEYVYDPFGRLLSSTGELAEINPFRFSSEYHDDETGLVYYNYRYYSPELGRWISRDPIEEEGGVNLYAMVENSPVNKIDLYGNISRLFTQIYMYWATRMVIGSEGGILGNIYNGATSSSPLILYDANKELVSEIKSAALFEAFSKAKLDQVFFKGGLTRKWQKYGVEKQNLATLAGGTLGKYEAPPSIWFWLNTSAWVYVQGTYEAKCDQGKFLWREAKFVYQWLDQIDGRSFAEAYQRGAFSMHDKSFGSALGGVVSATIEGMYDLVFDKMHNVDFRVEIRGLTELPDGFMDWPTYYPSKYLNNK